MSSLLNGFFAVSLIVVLAGCNEASTEVVAEGSNEAPVEKTAVDNTTNTNTEKAAAPGETRVAKVVFVGQKEACACTRTRIDNAWPVLEKSLSGYKGIDVKRLQTDVDEEEADKYDEMRTMMVAPGIYFLDKEEKLVDMIQGEVTESQVLASLQK